MECSTGDPLCCWWGRGLGHPPLGSVFLFCSAFSPCLSVFRYFRVLAVGWWIWSSCWRWGGALGHPPLWHVFLFGSLFPCVGGGWWIGSSFPLASVPLLVILSVFMFSFVLPVCWRSGGMAQCTTPSPTHRKRGRQRGRAREEHRPKGRMTQSTQNKGREQPNLTPNRQERQRE